MSETTPWPPSNASTLPRHGLTALPNSSPPHSTYTSSTETQSLPLPSTYGYTGIGASPLGRPSNTSALAPSTRSMQPDQWGAQPSVTSQLYTPYQITTLSTVTEASGPTHSSFGSRASPYTSYHSSARPGSEPYAADEMRYSGVPEPMGPLPENPGASPYTPSAPAVALSHSQQSDMSSTTGSTAPSLPSKKSDLVYMSYGGPQDYLTPGAPKTGPPAYTQ
ncbi:hypothetical protein BD779DRAFT_1528843 [Infundibulicybe gibba]|nr:hypothetical protein BD779DRAFT_1528843 [Infundibulicybe gibba]